MGMSNFAKWYKQKAGGGLATQFLDPVPTEVGDFSRSGQECIATRAHNSVAYYRDVNRAFDQDTATFITEVRHALASGAVGVIFGMDTPGPHVVMAIAFSDNQIALYDPNHPGVFKAMDYSLDPVTLTYGTWGGFGTFGNGELAVNEQHEHLLQDAQAGFHGENETKVEVTSHTDGQKVSDTAITLEGKVHSGQVLISELSATVLYEDLTESEPVTQDMPVDDDTFVLPLTLKKGLNWISFKTKGYVAYLGVQDIPNTPELFQIEVTETPSVGSSIVITASGTDESTSQRVEWSSVISTNLTYNVNTAQILRPGFDFTQCDGGNYECDLVSGLSVDSPDILAANQLPVAVEHHVKVYNRDDSNNWALTSYVDGQGTLTCESVHLRLFVKPGGTAASHEYQVFAEPTNACLEGIDTTPMLVGKYRFSTSSADWVDSTPEMLTLYRAFPSVSQLDSASLEACEQPPAIPAGAIEPWTENPTAQASWTRVGSLDACDYYGTTTSETTSVALTLVP
jgi:hypothetical protein